MPNGVYPNTPHPHNQTPKNVQYMFNSPYTQPTPSLLPHFQRPFHAVTKETVPALVVAPVGMLGGVKMPIGYPSTPSSLLMQCSIFIMLFLFIINHPTCSLCPSNRCFRPHQERTWHFISFRIPHRRFSFLSSRPLLLRHSRCECSSFRFWALISVVDGTTTRSRLS